MTSSNGGIGSTTDGNAFASFLLGYPSARTDRASRISVSTPLNLFTNYYGGYAQDDWRVSSKLTLNYGLRARARGRLAREGQQLHRRLRSGADQRAVVDRRFRPIRSPARRRGRVTGGLMYAGVDGNKTYQGNPPAVKWSPRVGAVYSLNTKTVLRGGYGLYWAPFNYPAPSTADQQLRPGRLHAEHDPHQQPQQPDDARAIRSRTASLRRPATRLGALTNLDSNISYVDQNRDRAARAAVLGRPAARAAGQTWR